VTRSELIAERAVTDPQLRVTDAEAVVHTIVDTIMAALLRGDRVEIRGFGVFAAKVQRPRIARDPRTGAPVRVEQKIVPTFKAGKELQQRMNRNNLGYDRDVLADEIKRSVGVIGPSAC
jgi:integration host factor subunit beta